MSGPLHKGRAITLSQENGWLRTWPELSTRPDLLAELRINPKFRRFLFSRLANMDVAASMGKHDHGSQVVASHFLTLEYKNARSTFLTQDGKVPNIVYAQAIGVLKNHLLNLKEKLGRFSKKQRKRVKNRNHVFVL